MSKKFVNNKFNGAINGKRCKDYYNKSKKYGGDLYEQIEIAKEILGVEEIDGVQFTDEFWTKVFLQSDEDEYCGGIKLILSKDDSLYSESNVALTLEKIASDILGKDTKKISGDKKIKVYHSKSLFDKASKEYEELKRIGERSTSTRGMINKGMSGEVSINDLEKGMMVDISKDKLKKIQEEPVLANLMNYKLEKDLKGIKDWELEHINDMYKDRYPIVDLYYQEYLKMKRRYNELTYNPKEMWEHIEDVNERKKAKFRKLTNKEKIIRDLMGIQVVLLKDDFINIINAKIRPILFKAPLPDEGCPEWEMFDETDPEHIKAALRVNRGNDMQDELSVIIRDLEITVSQCKWTDRQKRILELLKTDMSLPQIAKEVNMDMKNFSREYDRMCKRIVDKNYEKIEDWYYLNIRYGSYKKCNKCKEVKLTSKFNKNGKYYFSKCKECQKKK